MSTRAICDPFEVLVPPPGTPAGVVHVRFTPRGGGERLVVKIDVPAETLRWSLSPGRRVVFTNRLANEGFLISPLPDAVEQFLHFALFPETAPVKVVKPDDSSVYQSATEITGSDTYPWSSA